MEIIDLSVLIENNLSEPMKIRFKRLDYYKGAKQFCRNLIWNQDTSFLKRLTNLVKLSFGQAMVKHTDFPKSAFLSLDTITMPTHMGTHIDAPFHYGPRIDGQKAKTVDELPLEWFFNPGVKIDLQHKEAGEYITPEDLITGLKNIRYTLKPLDIVLLWTGTDKLWGSKQYFTQAPGMSRAATDWLVKQGIKVIGIDTYGFDRPFGAMLREFSKTKNTDCLWPAHFYGRENEYIQIERLTNLAALPNSGFNVCCFPIRIKDADASWVRAVAILNHGILK